MLSYIVVNTYIIPYKYSFEMISSEIMHHCGIFLGHQLLYYCKEYKQLYSYSKYGTSVYIYYTPNSPFRIQRIAVQLCDDYMDLFECDVHADTDIEAKAFANTFAEELISYRETYIKFLDAKNRNIK